MAFDRKGRKRWSQRVGKERVEPPIDEWQAFLNTLDAAKNKGVEEQTKRVAEGIERIYPYKGKAEQIEAIRTLIYDRKDLILIAKTSFGKSMIPQAVSALRRNSITIMIIPLTALGQEQHAKMQQLPNSSHAC